MFSAKHPLWNVGFRSLFILAATAGLLLPLFWVSMLHGLWSPPQPVLAGFSATQWHAHEMFFGFAGAVLIGFLLTASKNWVGITGHHGHPLILLALFWCLERWSMTDGGNWPAAMFWLGNFAFIVLAVGMLLQTLLKHRANDSYRSDNLFFLIALPLLIPAKFLLLQPASFASGITLTQGIFRLAFLLMLERTIGTFMKNGLQLEISRQTAVDRSIKVLAVTLCATPWLPEMLVSLLEISTAGLLLWRLRSWHPLEALQRLEIGIMYGGYLALTAALLLAAFSRMGGNTWVGSLPLHVFTLGCIGCIAPAMFIRISNGHTGRRVIFGYFEKSILWLMLFALLSRTLLPQLLPALYMVWLDITAGAWAIAWSLWLWRFAPYLWQARADGKAG